MTIAAHPSAPSWRDALKETLGKALLPVALVYLAVNLLGRGLLMAATDGIAVSDQELIGGDFLAFWTSANAFWAGNALEMYDRATFEAAMSATSGLEQHYMLWQYPPTAFFFFAPLGLASFHVAYVSWMAVSFAFLWGALRWMGLSHRWIAILLASPLTIFVLNSGQIGFFTTALMVAAVGMPGRAPIMAGVAAGLLTIKPQLGLLIPIAYMAGGYWRSFGAAAVTSIILAAGTTIVFGPEAWTLFYDSINRIYTDYTQAGGATPPTNMTTPLAQLILWGVPLSIASVLHYSFAVLAAGAVGGIWFLSGKKRLPFSYAAAFLCTAVILVTPYAYKYEMVILTLPLALLIKEGKWRDGDFVFLALGWILLASLSSLPESLLFQPTFFVSIGALILCGIHITRSLSRSYD